MSVQKILGFIATLGPIGYLTAPGTVATLVSVPFVFWVQNNLSTFAYTVFLLLFSIASFLIVHGSISLFKKYDDPSEVVLDEVVGCFVTFWAIPFCVPLIIFGLILFRFLDIAKIGFIGKLERVHGAPGIMLDDIAAAMVANVVLRSIVHFCL